MVAQKKPIENEIVEDLFIYEQRWLQDGLAGITYKNYQIAVDELKKKYPDDKSIFCMAQVCLVQDFIIK